MNSTNKGFVSGFGKGKSMPRWAYDLNRKLTPNKSMATYSQKGLSQMLKRRGIK